MQRLRSVLLVSLILSLTACTDPGETTAVGAATGGVIGAGLGAIVGSQVGSAGGGLAIGAVSGAAAGGLIGNKLEAQDEAIRTQDEALERQQQMMAAHERQLRELRSARDDGSVAVPAPNGDLMGYSYPGSSRKLSAAQRNRLGRGQPIDETSARARYRIEPEAVKPSRGAVPVSRAPSSSVAFSSAPKSVSMPRASVSQPAVSQPAVPLAPAAKLSAPKSTGGGLVERDLAVASEESTPPVSFKSPSGPASEVIPPAPAEMDTAPAVEKAVEQAKAPVDISEEAIPAKISQPAAPKTGSAECQKAGAEIDKATGSKDVADKLFHYRRALRLCPNEPQYHLGLGQVYQSLDRTSDAEFEYREALRLNPSMKEARENLDKLRF